MCVKGSCTVEVDAKMVRIRVAGGRRIKRRRNESYQTVRVVDIVEHKVDATVQRAFLLVGLGLHHWLCLDLHDRLAFVLFALRRRRRSRNGQRSDGVTVCGDVVLHVLQKVLEVVHREL